MEGICNKKMWWYTNIVIAPYLKYPQTVKRIH